MGRQLQWRRLDRRYTFPTWDLDQLLVSKDLFDREVEEARQFKGERQGRIVLAGFDGVYRLP